MKKNLPIIKQESKLALKASKNLIGIANKILGTKVNQELMNTFLLKPFISIGHTDSVNTIDITPNGQYIVSSSEDGTIKVWDIKYGTCLRTFTRDIYAHIMFSIAADGKHLVTGDWGGTIKIWDIVSGKCLKTLEANNHIVSVTMTVNGKYIVSEHETSEYSHITINIWDIENGTCIKYFEIEPNTSTLSPITSTAVMDNGKYIIVKLDNETIKLWDTENEKYIKTFNSSILDFNSASITQDEKYILINDNKGKTTQLLNAENGKCIRTFDNDICYFVTTEDKRYIITLEKWGETIKLYDIQDIDFIRVFNENTYGLTSIAVTQDGKYLVSGNMDKTIKLYDIQRAECIRTFVGHTSLIRSISLTPNGNHIVSGSEEGIIKLWDINTGKNIFTTAILDDNEWLIFDEVDIDKWATYDELDNNQWAMDDAEYHASGRRSIHEAPSIYHYCSDGLPMSVEYFISINHQGFFQASNEAIEKYLRINDTPMSVRKLTTAEINHFRKIDLYYFMHPV